MTSRKTILIGLGVLLFLLPLKFGSAIESLSTEIPPTDWLAGFFLGWPLIIAPALVFLLGAIAWWILPAHFSRSPRPWTHWLPLAWLATQYLALPFSIYWQTSMETVLIFTAATLGYYLAAEVVQTEEDLRPLLTGLAVGLGFVCVIGFNQHFGGLAAVGEYARVYNPEALTPDMMRKLYGDTKGIRIYSTFFYPNSFGGFLGLTFGPALLMIWFWRDRLTFKVRCFLVVLFSIGTTACLIWSRSKGGLVALLLGAVASLLFLPLPKKKLLLGASAAVGGAVIIFVVGYGIHDIHFALSTGSLRLMYWRAALGIFAEHFLVGTGPSTFGAIEGMHITQPDHYSRMAHNNFIQMASDSGVGGFVTFALLWTVGLLGSLRRLSQKMDWRVTAGLSAGLCGWMWHNAMDFDLYIPAIAFPAFILLGAVEGLTAPRPASIPSATSRRTLRTVMALALLAMLWPIGQRTRAAYEYGNAIRLTQNKNFFAATAAMERATQWAPGDAAYWDFLANLQTQTQPLAVIQSRERAVALDRYRPGYHWRLGNDYAVQDGRLSDRARREMDETRRLAPSNPDYRR